LIALVEGV